MKFKQLAAALSLTIATTSMAQDSDTPYVNFQVLKPELALVMARAALAACEEMGYQVGVTVVDRFGLPQVFLRGRYAGLHVYETSQRKAWTAVSFRTDTTFLVGFTAAGEPLSGLRHIREALPVGGALMVVNGDGSLLGAIGVSGAPGGDIDDDCAQAGIDAIEDEIAF